MESGPGPSSDPSRAGPGSLSSPRLSPHTQGLRRSLHFCCVAPRRPRAILAAPASPFCQAPVSKDGADVNRTGTEARVALCQGEGRLRREVEVAQARRSTGQPSGPAHSGSHTNLRTSGYSTNAGCRREPCSPGVRLVPHLPDPEAGVSGCDLGADRVCVDSRQVCRGGRGWVQPTQAGYRSEHKDPLWAPGAPPTHSARPAGLWEGASWAQTSFRC